MDAINEFLSKLAHNYVIIAAAAVIWFLAKAITGYVTYKHYNKKLNELQQKLDQIIETQQNQH